MTKPKSTQEVKQVVRQSRIWLTDFRKQINALIDRQLEAVDDMELRKAKENGASPTIPVDDTAKTGG